MGCTLPPLLRAKGTPVGHGCCCKSAWLRFFLRWLVLSLWPDCRICMARVRVCMDGRTAAPRRRPPGPLHLLGLVHDSRAMLEYMYLHVYLHGLNLHVSDLYGARIRPGESIHGCFASPLPAYLYANVAPGFMNCWVPLDQARWDNASNWNEGGGLGITIYCSSGCKPKAF